MTETSVCETCGKPTDGFYLCDKCLDAENDYWDAIDE